MKITLKIFFVLCFIALTGSLFAQNRAERRTNQNPPAQERNTSRWAGNNFTEEQQRAMTTLNSDFREAMQELRIALERNTLESRIASLDRDFEEMRILSEQNLRIRTEISILRINHLENIHNLLTPEQRENMRGYRGDFNYQRGRGYGDNRGFRDGGCCF